MHSIFCIFSPTDFVHKSSHYAKMKFVRCFFSVWPTFLPSPPLCCFPFCGTVWYRNNAVMFLNPYSRHPIARPWGRAMGVSVVSTDTDLCCASVTAVLYVISCYIGPRYNGTRLHINRHYFDAVTWCLLMRSACELRDSKRSWGKENCWRGLFMTHRSDLTSVCQ